MPASRLLILGGTGEAAELAQALAGRKGLEMISSLAGRVTDPRPLPGRVRIGGFGGAEGLKRFLLEEGIGLVVDATHPFAARITAHAAQACAEAGVKLLRLERAPWPHEPGDRWTHAAHMAEAADILPRLGRRAFLTVGAGEVAAFRDVPSWFLVRLLAPAPPPLPDCEVVVGRGPFDLADEVRLMAEKRIDLLVTKASGGSATYAKIQAARRLELPVLMVSRPPPPFGQMVATPADAVHWCCQHM